MVIRRIPMELDNSSIDRHNLHPSIIARVAVHKEIIRESEMLSLFYLRISNIR